MPDAQGSLQEALGERYAVESEIGRGGMAVVYRAHDRQLDRTVAIKVLSPELSPLLGEERFHREILVAARLQHPGIVPLYEAGGEGALLYFTMPFVEGETLRARLLRERQLPIDLAMQITLEVADALRFAHAHGIVHRDIKPENILLSGDRVQVSDFGIARAIRIAGENRLTSAGVAVGTPSYMSPEQASGDDGIDGRADVYSLACVCYEMLTGEPPFSGATAQAVVARHMAAPVPSLRVVRPTATVAFEQTLTAALAKAPADRPDADQFIHQLREAAADPEGRRAPSRRRLRQVAPVMIVALLAVVGWYVLMRPSPPLDRRAVVVFPFRAPGLEATGLGERVGLLIGSMLEHTEPLRWRSGGAELTAANQRDPGNLSRRRAQQIARQFGAAWYVDGELLPFGDSLAVTLRLHDAVTDSVYQQSATGPLDGEITGVATALAQQAVIPLLERLVGPARHVELTYLRDRNPAAIALWLQGEQLYRNARFEEALDLYLRALDVDATLAVAALTASGVAIWTRDAGSLADSLARLALRHGDGLPPRSLAYARGMLAWTAEQSDSAVAWFREVIAIDSLWPEGWMMLGDSYHHLLPAVEGRDSLAALAFGRAVALDPTFGPALFHLTEETLRQGRLREGERLLARFRAVAPSPSYVPELEMLLACQRNGAEGIAWRRQAQQVPERVLNVARLLGAGGGRTDCARAAADGILAAPPDSVPIGVRWSALVWLHHWAMARGDADEVVALIDSGARTVHPAAAGLHLLAAVEGRGDSARAAAVVASLDAPVAELFHARLWYLGRWAAHVGDTARLGAILARLETLAADDSRGPRTVADGLHARRALLNRDTSAALAWLSRMRPAPGELRYGLWESGASEQLLLAELLLATGQPGEALRVANQFDQTQTVLYLAHLPASLALRVAAAERLGDAAAAGRFRERLSRLGQPTRR